MSEKFINYEKFNKLVEGIARWAEDHQVKMNGTAALDLIDVLLFLTEEEIKK